MKIHQLFMKEFNESPILFILNPTPVPSSKQLPISLFEAVLQKSNDGFTHTFVEIPFKLETGQVEKISIDQVTKVASISSTSSILENQNKALTTSIVTFQDKLDYVIHVLKLMKDGTISYDYELIRKASKIINQLPDTEFGQDISKPKVDEFNESFNANLNECYLMSYVATMIKTSKEITDLSRMYHQIDVANTLGTATSTGSSAIHHNQSPVSKTMSSTSRLSKLGHNI